MKKILLVDDHMIIRKGIKYYFDESEEYQIVEEASNGEEALSILKEESIDLLITDISMPKMDGIELIKNARVLYPELKILVLTMHEEARVIKKTLQESVSGYVLKNSGEKELMDAIDSIFENKEYFDPRATNALIQDIVHKPDVKKRLTVETELSKREIEVLKLIAEEFSNQEIADKLFISVRTVDSHKRNLLEKTGAKNVAGLVMFGIERSLI